MITPTDNCAFLPCDQVEACALVGGCVAKRFRPPTANAAELKKGAPALVGTKPRPSRDPRFTPRHRKTITK